MTIEAYYDSYTQDIQHITNAQLSHLHDSLQDETDEDMHTQNDTTQIEAWNHRQDAIDKIQLEILGRFSIKYRLDNCKACYTCMESF